MVCLSCVRLFCLFTSRIRQSHYRYGKSEILCKTVFLGGRIYMCGLSCLVVSKKPAVLEKSWIHSQGTGCPATIDIIKTQLLETILGGFKLKHLPYRLRFYFDERDAGHCIVFLNIRILTYNITSFL